MRFRTIYLLALATVLLLWFAFTQDRVRALEATPQVERATGRVVQSEKVTLPVVGDVAILTDGNVRCYVHHTGMSCLTITQ